ALRALNQLAAVRGRGGFGCAPHRNPKRRIGKISEHVPARTPGRIALSPPEVPGGDCTCGGVEFYFHGPALGFCETTGEGGVDRRGTAAETDADGNHGGTDGGLVQTAAGVRNVSGVAMGAVSVVGVHFAWSLSR